jgi:hypothetical protein
MPKMDPQGMNWFKTNHWGLPKGVGFASNPLSVATCYRVVVSRASLISILLRESSLNRAPELQKRHKILTNIIDSSTNT